eukprot:GHVP01049847.1.p1 GENE.GHVP01049847.1~~GHVP01049847.1.p1  ORF type:complete len:294 (-),score=36.95 GHVP01049847.1:1436-2317(-)
MLLSTELSVNEKTFVQNSLDKGYRMDGRKFLQYRDIKIDSEIVDRTKSDSKTQIHPSSIGKVELGDTKVVTKATISLVKPAENRPKEGRIKFEIKYRTDEQNSKDTESFLQGELERLFKTSRAVNMDTLCVVPREYVWSILVTVMVIYDDGNLLECVSASVLTSLMTLKMNEVEVKEGALFIYNTYERLPILLTLNSHPLSTSFSLFRKRVSESVYILSDTTKMEEYIEEGKIVCGYDTTGKIASLSKYGGLPISYEKLTKLAEGVCKSRLRYIYDKIVKVIHKNKTNEGVPI